LRHRLKRFMGYAGCPEECTHVYKIKLTTFGIAKGYVCMSKKKIFYYVVNHLEPKEFHVCFTLHNKLVENLTRIENKTPHISKK